MRTCPLLSLCVATRNRGPILKETLEAILPSCQERDVEVVVVDGASTDSTPEVLRSLATRWSNLRGWVEASNSGVDGDFDKAVGYASGRYVWLLSDDDLPLPGALDRILEGLEEMPSLLVVDAEVWNADFTKRLHSRRFPFDDCRRYDPNSMSRLLEDCGDVLSFIGAVVVSRALWLERDRRSYYGTEFVHVGVLFQAPLPNGAIALPLPALRIRYGVGNWIRRAFEVWMIKWPNLIWSLPTVDDDARRKVVARYPWRSSRKLVVDRAKGWYGSKEYSTYIAKSESQLLERFKANLIARVPRWSAVALARAAISISPSRYATLAIDLGLPTKGDN